MGQIGHFVLEPQLYLLEADFFQLFLFSQMSFGSKLVKKGRVVGVSIGESLIVGIAGHRLHPDGLGRGAHGKVTSSLGIQPLA